MANHCFKLQQLTAGEMNAVKYTMRFFTKRGVKVTYLRRVVYIHLQEDQKYTVIGIMLTRYHRANKLQASAANMAWINKWHPDFRK